jgi:hypothetical protein
VLSKLENRVDAYYGELCLSDLSVDSTPVDNGVLTVISSDATYLGRWLRSTGRLQKVSINYIDYETSIVYYVMLCAGVYSSR